MANKRKYPEVKGYWVYSIKIPSNNKYYIGVSKNQCSRRWQKTRYIDKSLAPYLDEWDSMIKTVIKDGLTETEALKMEDELIQELNKKGLCINKQRSGLITNDLNAYHRELLKNNPEYREREKQLTKQWRKDNREQFNEYQREYQKQQRLKKKLEITE